MIPVDRSTTVANDEHPMDGAPSTSQYGAGPPSGAASRPNRDRHDDDGLYIHFATRFTVDAIL